MKFTPRPFQERMIQFVYDRPRCGVFAQMGLGKTSTVLTATERLAYVEDVYPMLVIAPKRVAQSVWPDECAKWDHLQHLRVSVVVGSAAERLAALRAEADIYTINYENVPWLVEHCEGWPFRTVVADESTKLKSFRTRQGGSRARALASVARRTPRWINLTGTPSPNGLQDLWGQIWFLDHGERLGQSFTRFSDRWFRTGWNGYGLEPMPNAEREIQGRISDICVSLTASDHMTLPPLIENEIRVALPPAAAAIYRKFERDMFADLKRGEIVASNAAGRSLKCLQLANGAAYTDEQGNWEDVHDAKLDALDEIVEEASGSPVLVAYHFKSDLARLQKRFGKQLRVLDSTRTVIDDWNAGRIRILAAHPASAGHGLNLQHGGNIIAFFGHWWSLEEFQQIVERIGPTRQAQAGLNRPVFVHYIVAAETVDELVMQRRRTKASVQDILMQALKEKSGV